MAIYDVQFVKPDVLTLCIGQAAIWARFCSLRRKEEVALPNSRMMIHQPLGGFSGQASDIDIHARN